MNKTLWDMSAGEQCRVGHFKDSLDSQYCVRLMELGFHLGEIVSCVMSPRFGAPKLYRVHNTIYSLDDQVANLIEAQDTHS